MADPDSDGNFGGGGDPGVQFSSTGADLAATFDGLQAKSNDLLISANGFSRAMASAFTQAAIGGKQLDNVLQGLALRLSSMALSAALKPITASLTSGFNQLFSGLFSGSGATAGATVAAATGAIKPFAAGGVIGTPTYFPMAPGGLGLAGEAGPEAIVPLRRGPDGRLGIAGGGGGASNVTINISAPDADSFRRSEVYLTGQIARAVARGRRGQ
jgi:phage-related minor tail protein